MGAWPPTDARSRQRILYGRVMAQIGKLRILLLSFSNIA